tara:strand:+ start:1107 stop:1763 length:657 start_codon:yes stop_codon:yes gene_type:complete
MQHQDSDILSMSDKNLNISEKHVKSIIDLQRNIRCFLAKYNAGERKIAIANTKAQLGQNDAMLVGMIVVYNFDNKVGIVLYKDIDSNNDLRNNFEFMLKADLPNKYIPHRDYVTLKLVENPKKPGKQIAKIVSILERTKYSYHNLTRISYRGKLVQAKNGSTYVHFKYHQMSYRTVLDAESDLYENMENGIALDYTHEDTITFNLTNRFRAFNITKVN